jgi:uncharacterized damage-inducible protein DinB
MSENNGETALPTRTFGWKDMFARPEEDPRSDGGFVGERDTLLGYLNDQRLTLRLKCAGLDAAGMARRSVPPSTLSLLGILRHLADVERYWFRKVMAGQDIPWRFRTDEDRDGAFTGAVPDPEVVAAAWNGWREEVAEADALVAAAPDLGAVYPDKGGPITLREILVHMIEEYARHNGHADLLRECVDGRVGQ